MLSSWLGTDRFGGKSQWWDATADRFAHDDDDDDFILHFTVVMTTVITMTVTEI